MVSKFLWKDWEWLNEGGATSEVWESMVKVSWQLNLPGLNICHYEQHSIGYFVRSRRLCSHKARGSWMMYQILHSLYGQIPPSARAGSSSATFGFPILTRRQQGCSPKVSVKVLTLKGICPQMLCVVVVPAACPQAVPSATTFQGKGHCCGHTGHPHTYALIPCFMGLPKPLKNEDQHFCR